MNCSVFVSQRTNLLELSPCSHFSPISFSYSFSVHYRHRFWVFSFSWGMHQLCLAISCVDYRATPYGCSDCGNQCPAMSHMAVPHCPCVAPSATGKMSARQLKVQQWQGGLQQITESQRHSVFLFVAQGSLCWLISVDLFWFGF